MFSPILLTIGIKNVWDKDFDTNTNVVDVYVNYLRTKIDIRPGTVAPRAWSRAFTAVFTGRCRHRPAAAHSGPPPKAKTGKHISIRLPRPNTKFLSGLLPGDRHISRLDGCRRRMHLKCAQSYALRSPSTGMSTSYTHHETPFGQEHTDEKTDH